MMSDPRSQEMKLLASNTIHFMKKLILLLFIFLLTACGQSVEKLNNRGNEAFVEQDYQAALEAYRSAQVEEPDTPEPYYNAANTFYRQDDYQQANLQVQQALRSAENNLAQSSFYNLGNTYFQSQHFEQAVEAYKQSLRLNPNDQDAKYNLELALQAIAELSSQELQQEGYSGAELGAELERRQLAVVKGILGKD